MHSEPGDKAGACDGEEELTSHPGRDALGTEATHKLQARAAHREVADDIPEEGGELEDGRDEGEQSGLALWRKRRKLASG